MSMIAVNPSIPGGKDVAAIMARLHKANALAGLNGLGEMGDWTSTFQDMIGSWSTTGQKILLADATPRGVYTQTGPGGTIQYVQPSGNQSNVFGSASGGLAVSATPGSISPLVLYGGLAVVAVLVIMQMNKR